MVSQVSTTYFLRVTDVRLPSPGPRVLLCLGLYGFNGLRAPFVPVKLPGRISFASLKPCEN